MKYVLGVFGFIILAIVAVVLLASANNSRSDDIQQGKKVVNLAEYTDNGVVTYTTQGEIVNQEDYREVRITIRANERRVQILSGYNRQVIGEQIFANNSAAFDAFLDALSGAGYTRERKANNTDMSGICPLGKRYIYQLQDGRETVTDLWSTSCSNKEGTFGGNDDLVQRLFESQIPNFDDIVEDVDL